MASKRRPGPELKKPHVKKGDKVVVISGMDRSEEPKEVLSVDVENRRVLVKDTNMRWKHLKRSQQNPQGGRVQQEFPIHISNVLLYSEKAGKGVRTRIERDKNGKRVRVGVSCGTRFDH